MFKLRIRLPSPGVLPWEYELPQCLASKASGICFLESQKDVGKGDSALIVYTQASHALRSMAKEPGADSVTDFRKGRRK